MFTKICLTLALGVSAALSLSVNPLTSVISGGQTTITWTSTSSDPTFSIELLHPSFNNAFAIANNVNPAANTLTLQIPSVPTGDGYTIEFVNVTDINNVYATSGSFSIGADSSSSGTGGATGGGTGSATGGATGSATSGSTSSTGSAGASATGSGSSSANSTGSVSGSGVKPSSTSGSLSGSGSSRSVTGTSSGSASSSSGTGAPSGAARTVPTGVAALIFALVGATFAL
ncbi:hypothetical protein B0H17DRAFT_1216967 [Mycena rosella]|uniref:Yeast cell wall synthesis Kre9/Knh1-like N-terminal domain-containing protein n=1 Tax=Mycena rosella TaxID=1033263 RepID=A0AAD7C317_MYCRO|nr:hypothetical protein B0H17DRAFT_1216967 [Mycena rosella]